MISCKDATCYFASTHTDGVMLCGIMTHYALYDCIKYEYI